MSNVNQTKFCFCLQPCIVYLYFLPINDLKNSKNISEHLNSRRTKKSSSQESLRFQSLCQKTTTDSQCMRKVLFILKVLSIKMSEQNDPCQKCTNIKSYYTLNTRRQTHIQIRKLQAFFSYSCKQLLDVFQENRNRICTLHAQYINFCGYFEFELIKKSQFLKRSHYM